MVNRVDFEDFVDQCLIIYGFVQVTLEIDVQVSRDLKTLVVEEAKSFGAHHVVLERYYILLYFSMEL